MKWLKRIPVMITMLCIVCCIMPVSAFAAPVLDTDTIQQFGVIIIDISGMADNVNMTYDLTTTESALTVVQELYQTYASETGEPYTLAALSAAALVGGAIAVVYDAVTGQGFIQLANETYINSMDGYWDYQLGDLGFTRDQITGLFEWDEENGEITPVQIFSGRNFNGQPISYSDYVGSSNQATFDNSTKLIEVYDGNNYAKGCTGVFLRSGEIYYYAYGTSYNNCTIIAASTINQFPMAQIIKNGINSWYYAQLTTQTGSLENGLYIRTVNTINQPNDTIVPHIPLFATSSDGTAAINNAPVETVELEPVIIGNTVITVPDTSSPNYEPTTGYVLTNVPWDPTWGDPLPEGVSTPEPGVAYPITDPEILNNLVPDLYEDLISGDVSIQDPPSPNPPDPGGDISEVNLPFLPITLPSFNFNLPSIWHYVREWVLSIGSWMSLMFHVWSQLPYAIVVPVYATAVIVIVLGLYKRFFM